MYFCSETSVSGAGRGTCGQAVHATLVRMFSSALLALGDVRPIDLASTTGLHEDASPRCQGATGAPPHDRRTRCRKDRRPSVNPWDARPPRRPALSVVYRKTGRGRGGPWLTRTRTRARARRLRVLACNTHNAGAGPRREASPCIRNAHRRAMRTSSEVVLASRPRAASNGHRSGGYQMLRRSGSGGVRAR